jgi:GAF domain-containing protein
MHRLRALVLVAAGLGRISGAVAEIALAPTVTPAAAPQPRAQQLVEQTLGRHPEVAHMVMHVTPPGKPDSENVIIASSIGRIGKRADEDDLRIMRSGKPEAVIARTGDRFNVSLPMLDRGGNTIGVLAVGFRYQPGDDTSTLLTVAQLIRDQLRRSVSSAKDLFGRPLH